LGSLQVVHGKVEVLEILKRARGDAGEGIPWNAREADVRQEIVHRTWKAGYSDKDGMPIQHREDAHCKSDLQRYRKNYVKIFGHD
jgi:hypothetical protein